MRNHYFISVRFLLTKVKKRSIIVSMKKVIKECFKDAECAFHAIAVIIVVIVVGVLYVA